MRINIAIKPSFAVAEEAIKISQNLAKKSKAYFALDNKNYFPHLTLYSPEFPNNNLNNVLNKIEKIAEENKKFKSSFIGIKSHDGYVEAEVSLNKELNDLHLAVIKEMNFLREGIIREKYSIKENLVNLSKVQNENIKKYGLPDVMGLYRPHLTLTRLENTEEALSLAKETHWGIKNLLVDTIAAFKMSDHGTCTSIIKESKLS